jgi:CDP-diacylglycerol--serine O-phosphatidyltransferase
MLSFLSLADVISLLNTTLGFLAIVVLLSDLIDWEPLRIKVSFSLILLALIADGLDGAVARKFRKSEIGGYLDSMADMTSTCVATSIFIYMIYLKKDLGPVSGHVYEHVGLLLVLIFFLSMGTVRLVSFHLLKNKHYFIGFPAPAGAILLLTVAYLKIDIMYLLVIVFITSIAMVANIRFPKPGFKIGAIATVLIFFTFINFLLAGSYYSIGPQALLGALLIYVIAGPIYVKFFVKENQ